MELAMTKRVFEIAKELGIDPKAIVKKCQAEGIPESVIKNHMSTVSLGLEATIREWFTAGGDETAVETSETVASGSMRADVKRRRAKPAQRSKSDVDTLLKDLDVHSLAEQSRIALAARGVRRVAFMLGILPLASVGHAHSADELVSLVERAAAGEDFSIDPRLLAEVERQAVNLDQQSQDSDSGEECKGYVAYSILRLLQLVVQDREHPSTSCDEIFRYALRAAWWYQVLLERATSTTVNIDKQERAVALLASHIRGDFELLRAAKRDADERGVDLGLSSRVPPEFFGPLWRDGEPPGWKSLTVRAESGPPKKIFLQVSVPEGVPPEEAEARLVQLITAMSELHTAHGGSGLTISDRRAWESSIQPAEVPA